MSEADATATTMEPPKVTAPVTATGTEAGTLPPPMAEEEAVPPPCPDHKRKLGEAEVEEAMLAKEVEEVMQARDAVEGAATDRAEVRGEGGEEEEAAETEPKRLRMDGVGDGSGITQAEVHEPVTSELLNGEVPVNESMISSSEVHVPKECSEVPREDDFPSSEKQSSAALTEETTSHKIEIPHNKVGVLIGYSGETIRCLQIASDAKIEIAQYDEADPNSSSRPIELSGPLENTNKAEQLITDVIPQVDAGDSLKLAARSFGAPQSGSEQVDIHVPSEKAGLIIGKGGETIMALKTKSRADIQLIPQHLPEGDLSTEIKVRLTGNWNEIEVARTMILELISQIGGHEPDGAPQWGSDESHDYPGRCVYYQNPQYHIDGDSKQAASRDVMDASWNQMPGGATGQAAHHDGRYSVSYNTYSAGGSSGVQAPMYYSAGGPSGFQAPMYNSAGAPSGFQAPVYYSAGAPSGVQAPMYYSARGPSGVQAPMYYSTRVSSGVQPPMYYSARGPSGIQAPNHYHEVPVGYSSYQHSAPGQLPYEQMQNGQYYRQQSVNSQPGYQSYPPQQDPYGKSAFAGAHQGYGLLSTQPGATTYQGPTPAQQPYAVQGSTTPSQPGLGYGQPSETTTGATGGYLQPSRGYQQPASQATFTYPQQAMQPWQYSSTQPGYTNHAVANNANYQQSESLATSAYPQQVMQPAAYWQYPSTQPGYSNQTVANNANYQQPASHVASAYPQQGMQSSVCGQYPSTQPGYTNQAVGNQTVTNYANHQQPASHVTLAYPQQGMQSSVYGQYLSTQPGYTHQTVANNNASYQQPASHVASAYSQQGMQPGVYGQHPLSQHPLSQPGYTHHMFTNNANYQHPASHVASAYPQQGVQPGVYGLYPSTQPAYTYQSGYNGGSTEATAYGSNQPASGHGSVPEGNAVNQAQGGSTQPDATGGNEQQAVPLAPATSTSTSTSQAS